jgi:hypothetical protein
VTALSSRTTHRETITRSALHHYQGRNSTITGLVQAYRDGTGTSELRRRYNLSQGSVLKLLRAHGVTMRRQGLADSDLLTAAKLYRNGASLAQLGEQFGVSYSAVRRGLISAGAVLRPRGGSKPRS